MYKRKFFNLSLIVIMTVNLALLNSCASKQTEESMIKKESFGKLADGRVSNVFTLFNKSGMSVKICDYGAAVVSILVPDKDGNLEDVVHGYEDVSGYEKCKNFFGVIVGRYGNRIAKGKFSLDGEDYQLTINDGENHLHGGTKGYFHRLWDAKTETSENGQSVILSLVDEDGDQGYPGTVNIKVTYTLNDANELVLDYSAVTDKPTVLNPTHHSYFNLSGDPTITILDHDLMIDADKITPVSDKLIPTGEFLDVENTPFDFREATKIGARINDDNEQLKYGQGYDHNWVINNWDKSVKLIASLYDQDSGRLMEVFSDQPGVQFYSGNFLDGTVQGKKGVKYGYRTALCLETQFFPDSPNQPNFPSTRLNPGEEYKQVTKYKFSVK